MKKILAAFLLSCVSMYIFAAAENIYNGFNASEANAQLNTIQTQLTKKKLTYEQLYNSVQLLQSLQKDAISCIQNGKEKLQQIDELVNNREITSILLKEQDIRYRHLMADRVKYVKAMTECILFNYHTAQTLSDIDATMAKTRVSTLLARSAPVWREFNPKIFFNLHLNKQTLFRVSGIGHLHEVDLLLLAGILLTGFLLNFVFCFIILPKIKHKIPQLYHSLKNSELSLILALALADLYLHKLLAAIQPTPTLLLFFNACFVYAAVASLLKFFLYLKIQFSNFSTSFINTIYLRSMLFATILWIGYCGTLLIRQQWVIPQLLNIRFIVFITLISLSFGWLMWLIFKFPLFESKAHWVKPIKTLLIFLFMFMIVMAWLGYSNFAMYFIPNVILTLLIFFVLWKITLALGRLFHYLNDPGRPASEKFHAWLGLKPTQMLSEVFVIRLLLNFAVFVLSIFFLLKIWGVSQYNIDILRNFYLHGGSVYGIYITPVNIVRAAMLFCVFIMLGRALSTYVAGRSAFKKEKYRQDNIATLINYVVFTISLLIALFIAGANFTSLTVIAGALSIGIGFGLQYIASDLVSGILLLLHRPVVPGDRVEIENNEGYIKKIRLLSTQIRTLHHADVIIPNSNLVNKSVTNYTYRENKISRLKSQIILDSNSDLELAKTILLNVVKNNKKVIQEAPYEPRVLFELRPSPDRLHVLIDLLYYVKNVAYKQSVSSEINFEILKALKENNLCPGQNSH
nr:mechanosensitive ion channel [Legionella jordanis]